MKRYLLIMLSTIITTTSTMYAPPRKKHTTEQPEVIIIEEDNPEVIVISDDEETQTTTPEVAPLDVTTQTGKYSNTVLHEALTFYNMPIIEKALTLEKGKIPLTLKNTIGETTLMLAQQGLMSIYYFGPSEELFKRRNVYKKMSEKLASEYTPEMLGFYSVNIDGRKITLYDKNLDETRDSSGNTILHRAVEGLHTNLIAKILAIAKAQGDIAYTQYITNKNTRYQSYDTAFTIGVTVLDNNNPKSFVSRQQQNINNSEWLIKMFTETCATIESQKEMVKKQGAEAILQHQRILEEMNLKRIQTEQNFQHAQQELNDDIQAMTSIIDQHKDSSKKTAFMVVQEKLLKQTSPKEKALYEEVIENLFNKSMEAGYKDLISSDETDADGNTLLHRAVITGHKKLVDKLLETLTARLSDEIKNYLETKNNAGKTALDLATEINGGNNGTTPPPAFAYVYVKNNHVLYTDLYKQIQLELERRRQEVHAWVQRIEAERLELIKKIRDINPTLYNQSSLALKDITTLKGILYEEQANSHRQQELYRQQQQATYRPAYAYR